MEMSVHRYNAIEAIRNQLADHFLTDTFAPMKGGVLSHIAKVRGDKNEPSAAISPKRLRCKQQREQLVVRQIEGCVNDADGRSRPRADADLAIRKCVNFQLMQRDAQASRQAAGIVHIRGPGMDGDIFHGDQPLLM